VIPTTGRRVSITPSAARTRSASTATAFGAWTCAPLSTDSPPSAPAARTTPPVRASTSAGFNNVVTSDSSALRLIQASALAATYSIEFAR
jgi:hypothetical protein